jgi:putative FmdB family regulatory protein
MCRYDYLCEKCEHEHEQIHRMADAPQPCPRCGCTRVTKVFRQVPPVRVPDAGWQFENNGRGRYIGQLAAKPDVTDPNAFCRSRTDAVEKAKRQGWKNIEKV